MSMALSVLSGFVVFLAVLLVVVEVAMRRNGSGIARAVAAACMPKVTMEVQPIRADGTKEPAFLARNSKASLGVRLKLLKISVLMRLKVSLERLSKHLRELGG